MKNARHPGKKAEDQSSISGFVEFLDSGVISETLAVCFNKWILRVRRKLEVLSLVYQSSRRLRRERKRVTTLERERGGNFEETTNCGGGEMSLGIPPEASVI